MTQPTLFISHGSPDVTIRPSPVRDFLQDFGKNHPRPDAILVCSAHYETGEPEVGAARRPATIHDFGGFQPELYEMRYPAPGHPDLAAEVAGLLAGAGFAARVNPSAGFDHGVWTPMILAYPQADIPIVPLSVQPQRDAAHHYRMGQALSGLRERNILLAGSGHITHNLRAMFHAMRGGEVGEETRQAIGDFTGWIAGRLAAGDTQGLLAWLEDAPHALDNHPTPEHLMPFFFALGAGGAAAEARRIHSSMLFGAFNSDFWEFQQAA